ncbi:CUB domain-containing protein 2-like isoform X2 [Pecten maximus]|uniref:CUB domain-containing protein 2-like isoform X2 n=1 Tax=Pecten maximus TaxID=6579 RepID=UPI001458DF82|nr:CUB domain-containing protein 2-like isoform X2 [Pecten maximus]
MAWTLMATVTVFLGLVSGTVEGQRIGNGNETKVTHHVTSKNFPQPYPRNSHQQWNFSMEHGQWKVIFRTVDIEKSRRCQKDYLHIYDGENSKHPEKILCDKLENMADYETTHSSIRIVFHSDGAGQAQGFDMQVVHIPNEAAKISFVQVHSRNPPVLHVPLTVTLAILFLVLVALAVYFVISLRRKTSQAHDTISAIKPHRPSTTSSINSGRRYTRQLSADSDNLSHFIPAPNKQEVRN